MLFLGVTWIHIAIIIGIMIFVSVISSLIVGKFCRKTKILPNFPHFRDDGAEVDDNWSFSLSSTTGTGCSNIIDTLNRCCGGGINYTAAPCMNV